MANAIKDPFGEELKGSPRRPKKNGDPFRITKQMRRYSEGGKSGKDHKEDIRVKEREITDRWREYCKRSTL